jgi:hypothetical protein
MALIFPENSAAVLLMQCRKPLAALFTSGFEKLTDKKFVILMSRFGIVGPA